MALIVSTHQNLPNYGEKEISTIFGPIDWLTAFN